MFLLCSVTLSLVEEWWCRSWESVGLQTKAWMRWVPRFSLEDIVWWKEDEMSWRPKFGLGLEVEAELDWDVLCWLCQPLGPDVAYAVMIPDSWLGQEVFRYMDEVAYHVTDPSSAHVEEGYEAMMNTVKKYFDFWVALRGRLSREYVSTSHQERGELQSDLKGLPRWRNK
jgi:hypothetical protein